MLIRKQQDRRKAIQRGVGVDRRKRQRRADTIAFTPVMPSEYAALKADVPDFSILRRDKSN
jgi:hypothetical protein